MNKTLVSMNLTNPQTNSFKKSHISKYAFMQRNVSVYVLGISGAQNQIRALHMPNKSPLIEQHSWPKYFSLANNHMPLLEKHN